MLEFAGAVFVALCTAVLEMALDRLKRDPRFVADVVAVSRRPSAEGAEGRYLRLSRQIESLQDHNDVAKLL
ncbi:MAG: hypothetical protein AAGH60_01390 [Pseudomonadota bacterium]